MARPRNFDETQVLERAVDLFRARGFEATSMPELTRHLGICRQSLYNTFGDKRGLFLTALRRYGEREIDAKLAILAQDGDPLENLRTVLRGVAALATECPNDGCLTATAIVENSRDSEALAIVEEQVERLERGFADALTRAAASGTLRPDVRPEPMARSFVSTIYGLGILSRLPGSSARIGDAVASMLVQLDAATA